MTQRATKDFDPIKMIKENIAQDLDIDINSKTVNDIFATLTLECGGAFNHQKLYRAYRAWAEENA